MSRRPKPPPERAVKKPAKPGSGDEDARLWAEIARSVKPLDKTGGRVPEAAPRPDPAADRPAVASGKPDGGDTRPRTPLAAPEIGAGRPPERPVSVYGPAGDGLRHGESPGVDKRTAARFKRGLMEIEATLDLHGHTRDSGHTALTAFLQAHHAAGRRCVLVITGKGLKGETWTPGILRQAVPGWLNAPPLRDIVLSFAYAQPQHGGSGALYVLLRRRRDRA